MALVRCITAMEMGVDVHGLDYTLAAKRAVFDAMHHSCEGHAHHPAPGKMPLTNLGCLP
jgi:hypothetical protein